MAKLPPELLEATPRPLPRGAPSPMWTAAVMAMMATVLALGVSGVVYGTSVIRATHVAPMTARVLAVRTTEHGLSIDLTYTDAKGEHAATAVAPLGSPYAAGTDTQVFVADIPPEPRAIVAESLDGWRRGGLISQILGVFYALAGLAGGVRTAMSHTRKRYLYSRGAPVAGALLSLDRGLFRGRFLRASYRYDVAGVRHEASVLVDERGFRALGHRPAAGDALFVVHDASSPGDSLIWGFPRKS